MPITHINRRGKTYYLHQGSTKKGNPKYHFSLKNDGELVEQLPNGYEVYENPNSKVFLRRIKPRLITTEERTVVEDGVRELAQTKHTIVDVKGKTIIVYVADQDTELLMEDFQQFGGKEQTRARFERYLSYSPMMRFVLEDAKRRLFSCERWCFLGGIDDYVLLDGPDQLQKLVHSYVQHLGSDSFYELY